MASFGSLKQTIFDKEARKQQYQAYVPDSMPTIATRSFAMITIGLRWRTEKEVISGKGQFICGNKHCNEKEGLASYEVNFSYYEAGENKQALVKLVTCQRCAEKLVYKNWKEKAKSKQKDEEQDKMKSKQKDKEQRQRKRSESDDDTGEDMMAGMTGEKEKILK